MVNLIQSADVHQRNRTFRKKLLILLSTSVVVIGFALIIGSAFFKGLWHDALLGVGGAIFATGPITVIVWWVTDDIYRGELSDVIASEMDKANSSLHQLITASAADTRSYLRDSNVIVQDCQEVGVIRLHLTRVEALNRFSRYMLDEIDRAHNGEAARLWFVCRDLQGFLDLETTEFDPQKLIRAAASEPTLDLRILMADPEYAITRLEPRLSPNELRRRSLNVVARLQRDYHVNPDAIRFYSFSPTVFAIATSRHMLLNPYPLEGQGHRYVSIVVTKTAGADGDSTRDAYGQYVKGHFEHTWAAATTRRIDDVPPLVSRISLSKDQSAANALLLENVADYPPPTADLIEFSADTVRELLVKLAGAGTNVRLLLKHPDSASKAQRDKIMINYHYLREKIFCDCKDGLEVRFYKGSATIRGRRLSDRVINIGWYTPDIEPTGQLSAWEIVGHDNPTVTADLKTAEGMALNRMFARTFDGLWQGATVEAEMVS